MDKDGHPTADTQKAIKDQIINKEGFTISDDDKLYLELIQTAAEEIRTQLLHLDLDERPGVQRPASGKGQGQASQNVSSITILPEHLLTHNAYSSVP